MARRAAPWLATLLAALLVAVIAGVASSPFWAPAVAPLLPWSRTNPPAAAAYAKLAARVNALEQRPASPAVDLGPVKSAQAAQAQRVDRLAAVIDGLRQNERAAAATEAAMQQLAQRLDAIDAQSRSRAASEAALIQQIQPELTALGSAAAASADRLAALERKVRAQAGTDRNGTVLLLALLQMREAVEDARPFPAEYGVFAGLARGDPELAAAAEPLADAARNGVASRAVLRRRLGDLSRQIAAATQPPAKSKWWAQALDRVRGLVTIRRIDGAAQTGPEAAVGAARSALAQGDLAGAVSALGALSGADAESARPWLRTARERLAAEAALTHLQELLATRLGSAPTAPAASSPAASTGGAAPPAPTPAPGAAPGPAPTAPEGPPGAAPGTPRPPS
jgi:hypothetical protein